MKKIINKALNEYEIPGESFKKISSKCAKITCVKGNCFIIKEVDVSAEEKFRFLDSNNVDNVIYPFINKNGNFTTVIDNKSYFVAPYYDNNNQIKEIKLQTLKKQLENIHTNTLFKKELSPLTTRKKLEQIFNYLRYKFDSIEAFVRSVEERPFDEYSILILREYHNILDAKIVLANLNKKLIDHIKAKKSVEYGYIHNNPKFSHLINNNQKDYLISYENGKIGITTLDIVKLYIEAEEVDVNKKELFNEYFSRYDDNFYFDYFCFFVLLYYIKSLVIDDKDYVTSQSFVQIGKSINKFITDFNLK